MNEAQTSRRNFLLGALGAGALAVSGCTPHYSNNSMKVNSNSFGDRNFDSDFYVVNVKGTEYVFTEIPRGCSLQNSQGSVGNHLPFAAMKRAEMSTIIDRDSKTVAYVPGKSGLVGFVQDPSSRGIHTQFQAKQTPITNHLSQMLDEDKFEAFFLDLGRGFRRTGYGIRFDDQAKKDVIVLVPNPKIVIDNERGGMIDLLGNVFEAQEGLRFYSPQPATRPSTQPATQPIKKDSFIQVKKIPVTN